MLMLPTLCLRRLYRMLSLLFFLLPLLPDARAAPPALPHLTPTTSSLYIASMDSKAILRCDGATGAVLNSLGVGAGAVALALGPDHDLYAASYGSDSIQRFSLATGKSLSTFIPMRRGHLASPTMLAFGPDRNLYVANRENFDIRRYDGRTGAFLGTFVRAGSGGLVEPGDFAFGPDGNLYVINASSFLAPPPDEVLRFNGKTGAPMGAFIKAGSGLTEPHNLTFGPDGSLYVGGPTGVLRFSGKTGAFIRLFAPHDAHLGNVGGIAFGPDGDLYVSDWQKSDVVRYEGKTGTLKGVFVPPSGLGVSGQMGLASRYILFGPRGSGDVSPLAVARTKETPASPNLAYAPGVVGPSELPLLAAGTVAPDITVQDKTGKTTRLSDYRGKTVVLDFWATWCGVCLMSMPHTNEVAKRFADRNVVVLAVNIWDTQAKFNDWLPKLTEYDAMTFAFEPTREAGKAGRLYHLSGIPVQYVIDPSGKITNSLSGYGLPTTDLADALTSVTEAAPPALTAQSESAL